MVRRLSIAAAAVAMFAAACGGSGTLSIEEYFERLDERSAAYDAVTEQLANDYEADLQGALESIQATADLTDPAELDRAFEELTQVAIVKSADLFTETQGELRAFLEDIRALAPPDAARDAHEEVLAAGDLALGQIPALIDAVRNIESATDLAETISASSFSDAQQRFGVSCRRLETVAAENNIDVDLDCPQPREPAP